jgi:hypothetical protein
MFRRQVELAVTKVEDVDSLPDEVTDLLDD